MAKRWGIPDEIVLRNWNGKLTAQDITKLLFSPRTENAVRAKIRRIKNHDNETLKIDK